MKNERPEGGRGDAAAWIPLIALFTGARLEEIAQLQVDDVRIDALRGNVPIIRFTDLGDDQALKTDAARRDVPIHKELIKAGLLRFVAAAIAAR